MEPMNFDNRGVGPRFSTLPKDMKDLPDSVMSTVVDGALSSIPMVGDVQEILRQVAGLVWMPLPKPKFSRRSMKDK